jgi:hypothetical protein
MKCIRALGSGMFEQQLGKCGLLRSVSDIRGRLFKESRLLCIE